MTYRTTDMLAAVLAATDEVNRRRELAALDRTDNANQQRGKTA